MTRQVWSSGALRCLVSALLFNAIVGCERLAGLGPLTDTRQQAGNGGMHAGAGGGEVPAPAGRGGVPAGNGGTPADAGVGGEAGSVVSSNGAQGGQPGSPETSPACVLDLTTFDDCNLE